MNQSVDKLVAVDATRCPLCGEANQCAMAAGQEKCWCFTAIISEQVLARVPEPARDLGCVCEKCAKLNGAN